MEKSEPFYIARGIVKWKTACKFLKKLNMELPHDSSIALLDIYPRELKTYIPTKTYTWIFIAALFVIPKKWKQPICKLTEDWINKMRYIYTTEYSPAKKRNEVDNTYYDIDGPWSHGIPWKKSDA